MQKVLAMVNAMLHNNTYQATTQSDELAKLNSDLDNLG